MSAVYTVRSGDFLWKIVKEKYQKPGSSLTDRETRRLVQSLYQHNRKAIGANPDLIFAGLKIELVGLPAETAGSQPEIATQRPHQRPDPNPIGDATPPQPAPVTQPVEQPAVASQPETQAVVTPPAAQPDAPATTPEGITADIPASSPAVSWEHNYFNTVTTQGNVDYSSRMNMGSGPASNNVVPYVPFYYNGMVNSLSSTKTWLGAGINVLNLFSLEYLNGGVALGANSDGSAFLVPDLKAPKIGVGISWPIFGAYFLTTITGQNEVLAQKQEINKRIAAIDAANAKDSAEASKMASDAARPIQAKIAERNIVLGQLKAKLGEVNIAFASSAPRGGIPIGDHVIPYPFVNFVGFLFRDPVAIAEEKNKQASHKVYDRVQAALKDPNLDDNKRLSLLSDLSYLSAVSSSPVLPRADQIKFMSFLAYSIPQDIQVALNAYNMAQLTRANITPLARRSLLAVFRESPQAVQTAVLNGYQNLAQLIETQLAQKADPKLAEIYQRLVALPAIIAPAQ